MKRLLVLTAALLLLCSCAAAEGAHRTAEEWVARYNSRCGSLPTLSVPDAGSYEIWYDGMGEYRWEDTEHGFTLSWQAEGIDFADPGSAAIWGVSVSFQPGISDEKSFQLAVTAANLANAPDKSEKAVKKQLTSLWKELKKWDLIEKSMKEETAEFDAGDYHLTLEAVNGQTAAVTGFLPD